MSIIKTTTAFTIFTAAILLLSSCSTSQLQRVGLAPTSSADAVAEAHWARDEFDLQRVGPLLERSHNPQEFETYLNESNGINNLDLNGDGYVDYLSVEEYHDRGPYERGLSIYDSFGPDQIQEVATVVFYRDDPTWPGARVLVTGDDVIYGDDIYYVTDWYDRPVDFITFEFTNHDPYRSPYYYGYYPTDYVVYDAVDTPVYVTRVQRFDPQPVLVYTQRPDFISKVDIRSPNTDKHFDQVFAKMVKPTREQQRFIADNHARPEHARPEQPAGMPNRVAGPPAQEKVRGVAAREQERKATEVAAPTQAREHDQRPHGRDQRMTLPEPNRAPRQVPQVARDNQPKPDLRRSKFDRPEPQVRPVMRAARQNPQGGSPPQMRVQQGPPAGRQGPPAQRGGGGKKKG